MTGQIDISGFDFSSSFKDVSKGLLLKPLLHTYLYDAKFPAWGIEFPEEEMERKPDNWFHPSTHPLWREAVLYRYLAHPESFPLEKKQYMGTLSVTMGKMLHEFIQMCLKDMGALPPELQVCHVCPPERECKEAGVIDHEIGERGHVDGLLDLSYLRHLPETMISPVFEFKSTNGRPFSKLEDLDTDGFKKKWPEYYAQQQSYQRMSGRRMSIVIMMETSYPWDMREFHIPFDLGFSTTVVDKYRRVRKAVEIGQPPTCCGFKTCAANLLCRVNGDIR